MWDIVRCVKTGEPIVLDESHLVGGRKSGKTTTYYILYYLLAMVAPKEFGWYSVRKFVAGARDLLDDACTTYDSYGIDYHVKYSTNELTINGNKMRCFGINSSHTLRGAKKAGLPRFGNVKYAFIFFEERFEFEESDVMSVVEAVRSITPDGSKTQYIILNACNPWAKNSPYIEYLSKIQSWDINALKTKGNQIGLYDVPVGNGYTKKMLIQYTNWRISQRFLTKSEITNILDTWNKDKRRAATVDWGLPGYEDGAIYTHVLHNLTESIWEQKDYLCAGGDYGWGRDEHSGKTVFFFGGANIENGIDLYGEYVSDNKTYVKSPVTVASEVVDFYCYQMRNYMNRVGLTYFPELCVRVDNMADGMIAILNQECQKRRLAWLRFGACKKYPVQDRIEITIALMSRQMLRVNTRDEKYPVKLLQKEFELSYYEKTEKQKRAKKDDHAINAYEYAIENVLYKFGKEGIRLKRKVW